MAKPRVEMADAIGHAVRGFSSSWIVFFIGAGSFIGVFIATYYEGALARFFGAPAGEMAVLIDIVALVPMPIIVVLWVYLRRINNRKRAARSAFIETMDGHELLSFVYDPQRVYQRLSTDGDADTYDVTLVWDADGPVTEGNVDSVERAAFQAFDRELFMRNY